ncbi:MAG: circadian clock KaiB family protein [Prochloraceae cyanobacterium]
MKCQLKLYVANNHLASIKVQRQFQKILKELDARNYQLEIIDIKENPYIAERDRISAIPTMVKVAPLPIKRAIGDITELELFLEWLGNSYELD